MSVLTSNSSTGCELAFSRSAKYPLMPFLPLLLLKLQAWQDHGESAKLFMRDKQPTDVQDILELLRLAEQNYALSDTTGITATVGSGQPISR